MNPDTNHWVEIAIVAGIVLLAMVYLTRVAYRKWQRKGACGGSCCCQASPGKGKIKTSTATLTIGGKRIKHHGS